MKNLKTALRDSVPRALCASLSTAVMVALCGQIENGNAVAPINAISHILWDEKALAQDDFSLRYTGVALILNASANFGWALIFEMFFGEARDAGKAVPPILGAMAVAALAFGVDYHIVPPRLTPGFEHRLSRRALWPIYAALALGLMLPGSRRRF